MYGIQNSVKSIREVRFTIGAVKIKVYTISYITTDT